VYTQEQVEKMSKAELHKNAKAAGIKYGKLSLMQTREALVAYKPDSKPAKKKGEKAVRKKRSGTKMELALEIVKKNPNLARKEIIAKFISEAKLTKAGSATYYALVTNKLKK
jgi:hypothetical protein